MVTLTIKQLPIFFSGDEGSKNCVTWGAFHLVKNSENFGLGLNGKRFFGSPDWKIPRKSGTAQKVVPFSRLELPDWFLVFQLHLPRNLYQFQAHGNRIFTVINLQTKWRQRWCISVRVAY